MEARAWEVPPAVLLYFSSATPTADGRATLIAYFLATDAIGFALMAAHGLVDSMVLSHTLWFAPVAIGGIAVGQHVFGRTGGTGFKTTVLSVLIVLSLAMLGRALFVG